MNTNNYVRLSGIAYESLVNGPGLRRVFFAQGCRHNCAGCFNPSTHSFDGGKLENMDVLIDQVKRTSYLKGVTFSGGDPFEQADKFAYFARKLHEIGLNIWCYTGYTYEEILSSGNNKWMELLQNIDVLVDGKFVMDLKDEDLKYRGSSNQRIIDVQKSLNNGCIFLYSIE